MKYYAQRDAESLGGYYLRHVEAMTAEKLHEKPDIAAELAWRDAQIERLKETVRSIITQAGDDLCWRDVYTELGKLVGVDFTPKLMVTQEKFLENCKAFDTSLREGLKYSPVHAPEPKNPKCHADRDGDCSWSECPQNRDGEPQKSGRGCALPWAWNSKEIS